jgi:hypothetical protein
MAITQLINSRGNAVKNQFIIQDKDNVTFQSYDSKIATYNHATKELTLYGYMWDYSNTTRKHFSSFLNNFTCFQYDNKKAFETLIKSDSKIKSL